MEQDSPRGRLYLARALAEGRTPAARPLLEPLERCLDCRACESACPSGVRYHLVLEGARERIAETVPPRARDRAKMAALDAILTRPLVLRRLFDLLGVWEAAGLRRLLRPLLPPPLRRLESFLPPLPPRRERRPPPPLSPATGPLAAGVPRRVALFTGCVMTELFGRVHQDTVEVLNRLGVEVVTPARQFCCGALSLHAGARRRAVELAARNVRAFPAEAELIVFDSAGCGAMLKDYGRLLADTPLAAEGAAFAARARDVCELLAALGPPAPPRALPLKVTYDDPCHLLHAQGIREEPRRVLRAIPGLELREAAGSDRCCGAAGIYNLMQPGLARRLQRWKADELAATGAEVVASGNPGCLLQIGQEFRNRGLPLAVVHPVELYARAWRV